MILIAREWRGGGQVLGQFYFWLKYCTVKFVYTYLDKHVSGPQSIPVLGNHFDSQDLLVYIQWYEQKLKKNRQFF
jgi:hypothetical protein